MTENYDPNGKDLGDHYYVSYSEDYSFGLTFLEWMEGTFNIPKDRPIYEVTDEEFKLVKDFYVNNLYFNREKETKIIKLNL